MDAVFFPPSEHEKVVLITYPKYYIFNLITGEVTGNGEMRHLWPQVSMPPVAAFRISEFEGLDTKDGTRRLWFPNSTEDHPIETEGYIVFFFVSLR